MEQTRARWRRAVSGFVLAALSIPISIALSSGGPAAAAPLPSPGYWLVASDGGVYHYGTASFGSLRGSRLAYPVAASAAFRGGTGYWIALSNGAVYPFGNARSWGSLSHVALSKPIVAMAPTPSGDGYWLVGSDGGIFHFGDAGYYGSLGRIHLNKPIVGMAPTKSGHGYWLVASDGGLFHFGDAGYHGSLGAVRLNRPIVGMAATPSGLGYWMVASDGGIFHFGDAAYHGSTGNVRLNAPVVGMAATAGGGGYWLLASDGGIFHFGDAVMLGSAAGSPGPAPFVSISTTRHGYPFPPGGTGYDVSNYQCGQALPAGHAMAVVEIAGYIQGPSNRCYTAEAAWAGINQSSYIFMDGLPSPAPAISMNGPAGACRGNVSCESYNFGWNWAVHWVNYSHSVGVYPSLWWLDVEPSGWATDSAHRPSNGEVISGAVAGIRATGAQVGIYSTHLQWGEITGGQLSFPGIPLWVPGAGNISGYGYTATNYCTSPAWAPRFAGGDVVMVQYGYGKPGDFPGAYSGPGHSVDLDYACP